MGNRFQLTVSPDRLVKAAEEWRTHAGSVEMEIRKIEEVLRQTAAYWQGNGADSYRSCLAMHTEEASACVKPVKNKYRTLLQMAGVYERSETVNREKAGSLAADILK